MTKPSREILAKFFAESELFNGIDTNAAVEEFFNKVYANKTPSYIWLVIDGSPVKPELVGAFNEYEDAEKMHSLLPNSGVDHFILDDYCDDVIANHRLFDVELDTYGELISVEKTVHFISGIEEDDQEEDEKTLTDGSYIYKLRKRSYFAADENEAVSLAKIAYQSNKDFQDHADDGVGEAEEEFKRELALGLVRVAEDGRVVRVETS